MTIRKEPKEKPFAERREGNRMQIIQTGLTKKRAKPLDWICDFWSKIEKTSVASVDSPPHDGLTQFERDVIQECREMGMADDEIQKWMKEI